MKTIQIKASDFFDLLRLKEVSMWDIFAQMIDGEEKEILFLNDENQVLFNYILPTNLKKLQEDTGRISPGIFSSLWLKLICCGRFGKNMRIIILPTA